ncbi:MAG: MauE/DoxX family redox-associated membrane protein [Actinomycetota bacterium]
MLAAPFFLSAGLLIASGVGKLVRPAPAAAALRSAGLGGGRPAAGFLGLVEVVAGGMALWRPGPLTAGAVALLYAAFAAFLVRLLRSGGAAGCGCLGGRDVPASALHVALDLVAAAVAGSVAAWPVAGLGAVFAASPAAAVPLVVGLIGGGALLIVAVAEVPRAWSSYRPAHEEHAAAPAGPRPIAIGRPR